MAERSKFYMKFPHQQIRQGRFLRLEPAERWCFIALKVLANESPECGKLLLAPGIPLTMDEMRAACRLTPSYEHTFDTMLEKATQLGLMVNNGGCWVITGHAEEQARKPSDYPEAARRRQAESRAKKRGVTKGVTKGVAKGVTRRPPNNPHKVKDIVRDRERDRVIPVTPFLLRDKGVTDALAKASYNLCLSLSRQNFPNYSQEEEKMWHYCYIHAPSEHDIQYAFLEACRYNKLSWVYVEVVLERRRVEGYPPP